jgi:uncharacterized membrane protein
MNAIEPLFVLSAGASLYLTWQVWRDRKFMSRGQIFLSLTLAVANAVVAAMNLRKY